MFLTTNLKRDWSAYFNTDLLSKTKTKTNKNLICIIGYVHTVTFSHRFLLFGSKLELPWDCGTIQNHAKTLPCARSHSLHPVYHTRQLDVILPVSLIRKSKFYLLLFCNVNLEVELIHKKEVEEHQLIMSE